jgi:D-alanyl-D-alanine carboxypeptidase
VSVVVLQLAEHGRLSLDARLPQVLPASIIDRFANTADITVGMLLGHRSGIPGPNSPAVADQVARDPAKVWTVSEFLDLAAAQPPEFRFGAAAREHRRLASGAWVRACRGRSAAAAHRRRR